MDNRPARIGKNIIAFRDSSWLVKFNFPEGYDQTGLSAYLKLSRHRYDTEVATNTSGRTLSVSLTADQVMYLPNSIDLYIANNDMVIIAGTINVRMGGDDDDGDDGNEFEVQIGGDEIVVVEILGMDLIAGQVEAATAQAVIATTQAGIATDKAEEGAGYAAEALGFASDASSSQVAAAASASSAQTAETNAEAAQVAAEAARDTAVSNAIQTTADRVQTGLDAASALSSKNSSAISESNALASKVAAESARDAALIQAGVYTTEALGRAAVADGQAFKVQGAGEVAAYEYRRINSGISTLIATYPSVSAVTNHGLTKETIQVPPSNNFLDPNALQVGFYVTNTGNVSATTSSYAIFTGTWGANTAFVIGGVGSPPTGFSFAQYNSSGTFIAGTYVGTDNVINPQKHASSTTYKLTIRVVNINQLNWGNALLPYDDYAAAYSYQISDKDALGGDLTFEPNLRSIALLGFMPTIANLIKSIRQQMGIDGYRIVKTVKKDATGDYTNLMAAIISVTDATPYNKYVFQVFDNHTGLLKTDFTNFPTHPTYNEMLIVKDSMKVIGMGDLKLIHSEIPADSTKSEFEVYETCHMEGSSEIENIYLRAKRDRYALHIDHGNTSYNQNCLIKITGCIIEHLGVSDVPAGNQWAAPDAVGIGTAAGFHLEAIRTKFIGTRYAFRAHTTHSSALPDHFLFDSCTFITKTADSVAVNLDNIGCQQKRFVEMRNCSIYGSFHVPNSLDALNTSIAKALPCIQVRGGGNSPFLWINNQTIGQVLRVVSNTTGAASAIRVIQDDAGLFGNTTEKPGSTGLSGSAYGDNELISAGTDKRYIIGHRLGNCTTVNKLLILNIDGTNRTVTFNQNYSNGVYTANPTIDATTILAAINSALSGFAGASYYQVNLDYYPELDDALFYKGNTSASVFIPKGSAVKSVGLNRCRIATTDEIPDGFAIEDIPVSATIIQTGRVIKNCIVLKTDRYCPLFETGSDAFVEGNCFKISAAGKLVKDLTLKDSFAKAIDSTRILLK